MVTILSSTDRQTACTGQARKSDTWLQSRQNHDILHLYEMTSTDTPLINWNCCNIKLTVGYFDRKLAKDYENVWDLHSGKTMFMNDSVDITHTLYVYTIEFSISIWLFWLILENFSRHTQTIQYQFWATPLSMFNFVKVVFTISISLCILPAT